MKNNNFRGFGSLGLQIVVSVIAVSVGVVTLMSSTAGMEGEPPGTNALKVEANIREEGKKDKIEDIIKKVENSPQDSSVGDIEDVGKEQPEEAATVDTSNEKTSIVDKNEEGQKKQKIVKNIDKVDKKTDLNTKDSQNKKTVETPAPKEKDSKPVSPTITKKEESKTEEIGFKTRKENDSSLEKGKETLGQKGVNGVRTIVYEVTYTDGKETSRKEISNTVTKSPIEEVIKVGTRDKYTYSYRSDLEAKMLELLNDYRKKQGLSALKSSKNMVGSARVKSVAMLERNHFGHGNPNSPYTENIGSGVSIENIFLGLQRSSGHNRNMIDSSFNYVGIGVIEASSMGSAFKDRPIIVTQHFSK